MKLIDVTEPMPRGWALAPDGKIIVDGSVVSYQAIKYMASPGFDTVYGNFYCCNNNLTSLSGAPRLVGGNFLCNNNKLKTLEHGPECVGGVHHAQDNMLVSLKGAPENIADTFDCSNNDLKTLEGMPSEVDGVFDCSKNPLSAIGIMQLFNTKARHVACDDNIQQILTKHLRHGNILSYQEELLDVDII